MLSSTPVRSTPLRNGDSPKTMKLTPMQVVGTPARSTPSKQQSLFPVGGQNATPNAGAAAAAAMNPLLAVQQAGISPALLQAALAMMQQHQAQLSGSPASSLTATMATPMHHGHGHMAASTGGVPSPLQHHPVYDCTCPTCQYYRSAMLMHHHAAMQQSPQMDQYMMYQPFMYMPGMYSPGATMPAAMSPSALHVPASTPSGISPSRSTFGGMGVSPAQGQRSPVSSNGDAIPFEPMTAAVQRNTIEQFNAISGNIKAAACTPQGRSLLQAVIRMNQPEKTELIFKELLANTSAMMLDPHACHVVRSLIEKLDASNIAALVTQLDETLVCNMSTLSQYTRRVLQTLFEKHGDCDLQYIVDIMSRNARYLAATQQGCIAMMRVYEKCNAAQQSQLVETLIPMLAELACDQFGNYVVQCVLEHADQQIAGDYAIRSFSGKFLKLACNKCASNAVEKLLRCGSLAVRKVILDELVYQPSALMQVAADNFGNFVVQTLIDTTSSAQEHKRICERLKAVIPHSPYGHKIESKMRAKRNTSSTVRMPPQAPAAMPIAATA